jgi:hypothetical protein
MDQRITTLLTLDGWEGMGVEDTATDWLSALWPSNVTPSRDVSAPASGPRGGRTTAPDVDHRWRYGAWQQTVCARPAGLRAWQRWTPAAQEAALILLREARFRHTARLFGVTDGRLRRLVDRVVPTADTPWWAFGVRIG